MTLAFAVIIALALSVLLLLTWLTWRAQTRCRALEWDDGYYERLERYLK